MEVNDPTQDPSLSPDQSKSLPEGSGPSLGSNRGVYAEFCFLPARIRRCLPGNRRDETGGPPPRLHVEELCRDHPRV